MGASSNDHEVVDALRATLKERDRLRKENARLLSSSSEPIAIIGMSCRFPGGVDTPSQFWDLVSNGEDAVSSFPDDRGWELERIYDPDPDAPGTTYVREGGFLADPFGFDAQFFGLGSHEALASDVQQRLTLECCWEALEDAGLDPLALKGSQTGVFAGLAIYDYGAGSPWSYDLEGYLSIGRSPSVSSGRVAYQLGFEGPALTLDTACSTSLVTMHLAVRSLRQGECSLALAGGATVLASPGLFIDAAPQRGVAADGRCKAFAEAADGVGFAEGAGIVALERLSDAQRNGHRVLALVRGSAVNQDGASNGLTAPSGPAQEKVIRQALASARLEPGDVDAVEAHGTGTTLGDPIEANALLATYGQDRAQPLWLGSVKSNIGHTQAAAGVAGVIKMVMAMQKGVLPRTLHVDVPSSKIEWGSGSVELLREPRGWEANGHPRRAGVSSFSLSGTNAHMILEEAPPPEASAAVADEQTVGPAPAGEVPLVLSAKSDEALRESAARLAAHLEQNPDLEIGDVAYSLATCKPGFERRAVVVGRSREELRAELETFAAGGEGDALAGGFAPGDGRPVFLFPGIGSQWQGMALELIESSPVFARRMSECVEAFEPYLEWSLDSVLRGEEGVPSVNQPLLVGIPALFATMVSLVELWRACGVEPGAVVGHSQGEMVAAHVAGALTLDEAAYAVMARVEQMRPLEHAGGTMASVALGEEELTERLAQWQGRVEIAALNGPASSVISGDVDAVEEMVAQCESEGVHAKKIRGATGSSHSHHVEPLREPLLEALGRLEPRSSSVPFHSTVTGGPLDTAELGAEYWYRNLRRPVRLAPVVRDLIEAGSRTLIEISPHPVLFIGLRETAQAATAGSSVSVLGTLRREEGGSRRFALSFAEAWASGAAVDWDTFFADSGTRAVSLPSYPFQRTRFWLSGSVPTSAGIGLPDAAHPLLGAAIEDPGRDGLTFAGRVSLQSHPWLADHAGGGLVPLPGAAFVELALRAGREVACDLVEELTLQAPLLLPETGGVDLRVVVDSAGERGERAISVYSRGEAEEGGPAEWVCNARGIVSAGQPRSVGGLEQWPPTGAEPLLLDDFYDRIADVGFEYGPAFQGLTAAWRAGDDVFAEVSLAAEQAADSQRFGVHPALLDAAMHGSIAAAVYAGEGEVGLSVPFVWKDVALHSEGAVQLRVRIRHEREDELSMLLADQAGAPVATVGSLRVRAISAAESLGGAAPARDGLLSLRWIEAPAAAEGGAAAEGEVRLVRPEELGVPRSADLAESALAATRSALELAQEWLGSEESSGSRLVMLSEGAVVTGDGDEADPVGAAVWGLLRSARTEHPGRFALIDSDGSEASQEQLPAALALSAEEPELALREGRLLTPRLVKAASATDSLVLPAMPGSFDPDRTVLVTGGTGGLGMLFARHLVREHGARHLLLVSRGGAGATEASELVAELEQLGATVRVEACDVSSRAQLEALLATIGAEHPLGAVVHAAGTLADGTVESLGEGQLHTVFAPKADAAWHLHELTRGLDLSAFVLFSSIAGTLGAPGQANYAAANAFLDALAARRQAEGLAAVSMAWGSWGESGGASAAMTEASRARIERSGVAMISDEKGLDLFDAALGAGLAQVVPALFDPPALRRLAGAGILPSLLAALVAAPRRRRGGANAGAFAAKLAQLAGAERETAVLDMVRTETAAVLGDRSPAEVDPDVAFKDLGFDSLAAVELRNRMAAATGIELATTIGFDYPSPRELAGYLLRELTGGKDARRAVVRTQVSDEPIAIVGMACRFPGGVESPRDLWELVDDGGDGITEFPSNRGWDLDRIYHPDPEHRGTTYQREGGFLHDVADFDPAFFGMSPREAIATDPQQRLLLESAWEALEDARIDPSSLRGSPTGTFAGVSIGDYAFNFGSSGEDVEGHVLTGMSTSVASGRIAYLLGLEGPALTVDTACSSSLVAIHLAATALRSGECSLALAGGVTVVSTPSTFLGAARQRNGAADGRSKAFAEGADGMGISEGVGLLVLERLSQAEAQGRCILATIRGSAVNQDGASNGLTAPSGRAQERVILQALANAGLEPRDVDMVEAHGTGTALGDPIEAGALLATYGQEREAPLRLGSVKSNIGHTQAAAGVAGVIKTVMALREGVLPQTLHVDAPTPNVDWQSGRVELLREPLEWKANGRPRRAGVSSFGISGTNAHLILEEGEAPEEGGEEREPFAGPVPLLLSAKSGAALEEVAGRTAERLEADPGLDPLDLAFSLATTRPALGERAVVVGEGREQLLGALGALAGGGPAAGTYATSARSGRLAYLFTGQGSQRAGMGRELYAAYPLYREALDQVCEELDGHLPRPLQEVLFAAPGSAEAELLDHTSFAQPALFATEVALYRLLESFGLRPGLLAGHSVGEISAAHLAGVFSLAAAAELICARGRLMGELPPGGAMLALEASEEEALESLQGKEERLSLAAVNGPAAVVLSGDAEALSALESQWAERGRKTKRLAASHAFHSPLIEPMLAGFTAVAEGLSYAEPQIPVVSNLSGELLSPEQATDPAYWVRHAREAVRFADAIATLEEQGASAYLELGPEPVLSAMAAGALKEEGKAALVPTLREGREERSALLLALGSVHSAGAAVDWQAFFAGSGARAVPLPTYPFQRRSYWLAAGPAGSNPSVIGQAGAASPLLGAAVEDPRGGGLVLTGRISVASHPWLADHRVAGVVLLPGAAFAEMALAAADAVGAPMLEELVLQAPLSLPETGGVQLQVGVEEDEAPDRWRVSVHARPEPSDDDEEGTSWTLHAEGVLGSAETGAPEGLTVWPPKGAESLDVDLVYDRLAGLGVEHGPALQGLTAAWRLGDQLFAEVSLAEAQLAEAGRYRIHPVLLDAALQATIAEQGDRGLHLPVSWHGVELARSGAGELRVRVAAAEGGGVALTIADPDGAPLGRIGAVRTEPVALGELRAAAGRERLLSLQWREVPLPDAAEAGKRIETIPLDLDLESTGGPAEAARAAVQGALALLDSVLAQQGGETKTVVLLSTRAVAAAAGETVELEAAAMMAALLSAQAEHPGRFVLVDSDGSEASAQVLTAALAAAAEEPQLALREGRLLVPRVDALSTGPGAAGQRAAEIDPGRTILVVDGPGGIGAQVSHHLAERHGAEHVLLLGDAPDRARLEEAIASIDPEHPLGAVICTGHPAAPEVAWHLHELTRELDLPAFVLFSSATGTFGGPGVSGEAGDSAFLDALARRRRAEGLAGTSIGWGRLEREGAAPDTLDETNRVRLRRLGGEALADEDVLAFLDAALYAASPAVLAVRVDRASLRALADVGALPPVLRELLPRRGARRAGPSLSLAERLASLPQAEHEEAVRQLVRSEVATVLGHSAVEEVPLDRPFNELGFDSLAAVETRNRLGLATGLQLPATVVFDYPTVAAIAAYLLTAVGEGQAAELEAELGKLEASLGDVAAEDPRRAGLAAHLRALAADLEAGTPSDGAGEAERLAAASDEELLSFIDEQIGG